MAYHHQLKGLVVTLEDIWAFKEKQAFKEQQIFKEKQAQARDLAYTMDGSDEIGIDSIRTNIQRIRDFLDTQGPGLEGYLASARRVIRRLDTTSFFQQANRSGEQVLVVDTLQNLAYFDPDSGGTQDIAQWCVTRWLLTLQLNPDSVGALRGLGQAWLFRAQRSLARIHHDDGSSSSGGSTGFAGSASHRYTSSDEERDAARATREADARLHTADYVEARGLLLPSTEYFVRAVEVADSRREVTGELLALAAEAFMSLGNVSYSSVNEGYFRQALIFLRRASQIPGYTLSTHLHHYLDDYGRLLD